MPVYSVDCFYIEEYRIKNEDYNSSLAVCKTKELANEFLLKHLKKEIEWIDKDSSAKDKFLSLAKEWLCTHNSLHFERMDEEEFIGSPDFDTMGKCDGFIIMYCINKNKFIETEGDLEKNDDCSKTNVFESTSSTSEQAKLSDTIQKTDSSSKTQSDSEKISEKSSDSEGSGESSEESSDSEEDPENSVTTSYLVNYSFIEGDHNNECNKSLITCTTRYLAQTYILKYIKAKIKEDKYLKEIDQNVVKNFLSLARKWLEENDSISFKDTEEFINSPNFEEEIYGSRLDVEVYSIRTIELLQTIGSVEVAIKEHYCSEGPCIFAWM